jgi:hypothetical protein
MKNYVFFLLACSFFYCSNLKAESLIVYTDTKCTAPISLVPVATPAAFKINCYKLPNYQYLVHSMKVFGTTECMPLPGTASGPSVVSICDSYNSPIVTPTLVTNDK